MSEKLEAVKTSSQVFRAHGTYHVVILPNHWPIGTPVTVHPDTPEYVEALREKAENFMAAYTHNYRQGADELLTALGFKEE
jgi:hypothetical protein